MKSLGGEALSAVGVETTGLVGDRTLALYDVETSSVVSGKNPRRWPRLRELSAAHVREGVIVRLPEGPVLSVGEADDADVGARLSDVLGRPVRLLREPPPRAVVQRLWPAVADIAPAHVRAAATRADGPDVTVGPIAAFAPGTFFDAAPVHIVFAASLRHLAALAGSDADPVRFRPNLVIEGGGAGAFVEDAMLGAELAIGAEVILRVDLATPRCIVPTLSVGALPPNLALLRTLARHHRVEVAGRGRFACFGVYASVVRKGIVRQGDPVEIRAPACGA